MVRRKNNVKVLITLIFNLKSNEIYYHIKIRPHS